MGVLGNSDMESGETDSVSSKLYILACGSLDFSGSRVIVAPKGQLGSLRDRIIMSPKGRWGVFETGYIIALAAWWFWEAEATRSLWSRVVGHACFVRIVLLELFCVKQVCSVER